MPRHLASLIAVCALALGCPASSSRPPPAGPGGDQAGGRPRFSTFELEDNRLVLPGPVAFTAAGELDVEASAPALWFIHDYLAARDYITLLRLEGHGDEAGEDAVMRTGDHALAVGRWLVEQGIACDRLLAAAYGDSKPVADASTSEGRARNRRIEAVNATLRGRPIGGMPVEGQSAVAVPVCD